MASEGQYILVRPTIHSCPFYSSYPVARHRNRLGALKVMRKQVLTEESVDGDDIWRANNEVKLYRAMDKNTDGAQWIAAPYSCFQDARNLYMFMEFAQGGNLRDLTGRYGVRFRPILRTAY